MSEIRFTDDQQRVIDAPTCDLLVSAAAGSGKTAVLVQRIMRMICDEKNPVDIDRILIVTFTRNAAVSMKDKIFNSLDRLCSEQPENKNLIRQRQKLTNSDITTIDSFCLKVVRDYFYTTDIEPNFRIADGNEADLLLYDAIKDVISDEYERAEAGYIDFMSVYGGVKNDDEVIELIKKLIRTSGSHPWHREFIMELGSLYSAETETELDKSRVAIGLMNYAKDVLFDCINILDTAYELGKKDKGLTAYINCIDDHISMLKAVCNADSWLELNSRLSDAEFSRAPSIRRKDFDEGLLEEIKELREKAKKLVQKLKKDNFSFDIHQILADNKLLSKHIKALSELTLKVLDRFEEAKRKKNIMEFSDIAHAALDILVKKDEAGNVVTTEYAHEIRAKYDEIMIDEYQDSNYIQEVILSAVSCREIDSPNVFMVGDVKQSIYKFRMAKPELFMDKYGRYGKGLDKSLVIDLKKNFRSAGCVIDTVNDVFSHIMTKGFTGISYDDNAALNQGASYESFEASEEAFSEIQIVDSGNSDSNDRKILTASGIAGRIKELMKSGMTVLHNGDERQLGYSDIVILVRSLTGSADMLLERLTDEGIPICLNSGSGYFKTIEIKLMLSYLKILDNPYQDIEMVAVLRSFCGGLSDEELALIKIFDKSVNETPSYLIDAARSYMLSNDCEAETKEKLSVFFETYEKLKTMSVYSSLFKLLEAIYENTGYYDYVQVLPSGNVRRANLDMLLVKVRDYENTDLIGISGFLRYVDRLIKYELDTGEANAYEGMDAVRIMTIHASKGLEFPVVILADTEREFNSLDEKGKFVLHSDRGLGLNVIDAETRAFHKSFQRNYISGLIHREMIAEEIRVLYVALTRAQQKLIMFATVSSLEDKIKSWCSEAKTATNTLSYSYIKNAASYIDLIMPVALLHLPSCDRVYLPFEGKMLKLTSYLGIRCTEADSLLFDIAENIVSEQKKELPRVGDVSIYDEVVKYLGYEYPYSIEQVPVKVSVSELKHEAIDEFEAAMKNSMIIESEAWKQTDLVESETDFSMDFTAESVKKEFADIFDNDTGAGINQGARRGTLTHLLMQKVITGKATGLSEIISFVEECIAEGTLPEDIRTLDYKKIERFLKSELGERVRAASKRDELYLEQPFVIGVPACDINEKYKSDETVLIQGIIDVFFEEDGEMVLLDYKTDRVSEADGEEVLKGKYALQLDLYARAIEKIKKISVKSKIIYSFSLEKVIYL